MNILQQIQQESIKRELTNRLNFEKAEQNSLISQVQDDVLKGMSEEEILEKARSGKYADTPENRKLGRVGQQYGSKKKEEETGGEKSSIIQAYKSFIKRAYEANEKGDFKEESRLMRIVKELKKDYPEEFKSSEKKEEGEIKVGQKYHSPAPKSGGEEIDFVIKNIENNKYTIETFNKEGRKGEHTFDEATMKELINESKLKKKEGDDWKEKGIPIKGNSDHGPSGDFSYYFDNLVEKMKNPTFKVTNIEERQNKGHKYINVIADMNHSQGNGSLAIYYNTDKQKEAIYDLLKK